MWSLVTLACSIALAGGKSTATEKALLTWFTAKGGYVHPSLEVSSRPDPYFHVGLYATEAIPRGAVLLKIPQAAMFCHADPCELIKNLKIEMDKGADSEFWPYLRLLPQYDLPFTWTADQLLPLTGITPFGKDPDWGWKCKLTREFRNVVNIVEVRAVTEQGKTCLVPLFDLIIHGRNKKDNTRYEVQNTGRLISLSTRAIEKDTGLARSLGPSSTLLFLHYGIQEQNPSQWEYINGLEKVYAWELDEAGTATFKKKSHYGFTWKDFEQELTIHINGLKFAADIYQQNLRDAGESSQVMKSLRFREIYVQSAIKAVNASAKLAKREERDL